MIHTVTCEARHLADREAFPMMRLVAVEGITFSKPLPIEQVIHTDSEGIPVVKVAVWHDQAWMFGMEFAEDDVITWTYHGPDDEYLNIPKPPGRDGLVRVHGTWKQRGEVSWAPEGYPPADL